MNGIDPDLLEVGMEVIPTEEFWKWSKVYGQKIDRDKPITITEIYKLPYDALYWPERRLNFNFGTWSQGFISTDKFYAYFNFPSLRLKLLNLL